MKPLERRAMFQDLKVLRSERTEKRTTKKSVEIGENGIKPSERREMF